MSEFGQKNEGLRRFCPKNGVVSQQVDEEMSQ